MKKALFLTLILFSGHALADYLTGAYVDTDLEVDTPFNEVVDDSANGFLAGYGWETAHNWLFVELTYTEFGDSDKITQNNYTSSIYDVTETLKAEYEGQALDLWLVGRFTLFNITESRPLNIVPRVGLTAASSQGTVAYSETVKVEGETRYKHSETLSDSDAGVGYTYGIGLEIGNVIPNMDLYVDWRKHEVPMTYVGEKVNFDPATIQAGFNWHF